jgi:hypothetical protein
MYPNTVLAGWQLVLMIIVPLASLMVWLTAVFVAARQPSDHPHEASTAPDMVARDDQEQHDQLAA